jgi:hypothetical protein
MKSRIIILIAGLLLIVLSSCVKDLFCVNGNGIIEVERRRLTSFDQIQNSTSFEVVYNKADTLGASIRAEQNIIEYIETNVQDGILEIRTKPGTICLDCTEQPKITISSPNLNGAVISGSGELFADTMAGETVTLKVSGSGDLSVQYAISDDSNLTLSGSGSISVTQLFCMNADMHISGSGNITVSGESENEHLRISGSGSIHAYDFPVQSATITISGSGDAQTSIEIYLKGIISGSGDIYVKGDPSIDQTITGSGRIIKDK